jgi:hypothetical protein
MGSSGGQEVVFKLLLEQGANVSLDAEDKDGVILLSWAVRLGTRLLPIS